MAKTHDRKPLDNSSSPKIFLSFLGCFGFSRKIPRKKLSSDRLTAKPAKHKTNRMFSMFAKKEDVKTVPFEAAISGEGNSDTDFPAKAKRSSKSKSKFDKGDKGSASKLKAPETNQIPPTQIVTEASELSVTSEQEAGLELRPSQTPTRNDILRGRKSNASRADLYHSARSSFSRVIDRTRSGFSQPNSPPMEKRKSTRNVSDIKQSQSTPSLKPAPKNRTLDPITNLPVKLRKGDNAKRYDPIVGMSIVMVTLLIMLLWGRLCAIMCTAIWFYLVPIFRSTLALDQDDRDDRVTDKEMKSNSSDLYSEEYRKRSVVFEGFLERNRRRVL